MEFVDRFQELVRNVAVAFKEPNKERSKCPRCKGSGLLNQRKKWPWDWQQKAVSNDPCWFCEGVGVMPIVGLNGFMIARASSAFHTAETKSDSRLPVKLHLYNGKFPETRCKFGTYKPHDNLFYNFGAVPMWLSGENIGVKQETVPVIMNMPPLFTREKTVKLTMSSRGISKSFRSKHFSNVIPRLPRQLASNSHSHRTSIVDSTHKETTPKLAGSVWKTEVIKKQSGCIPLIRSTKSSKMGRRDRNKIREEAKQQAFERAQRVLQGAVETEPSSTQTTALIPDELCKNENVSVTAKWSEKLRLLPWVEPSKRLWMNRTVIKDRTASHNRVPGKAFL